MMKAALKTKTKQQNSTGNVKSCRSKYIFEKLSIFIAIVANSFIFAQKYQYVCSNILILKLTKNVSGIMVWFGPRVYLCSAQLIVVIISHS